MTILSCSASVIYRTDPDMQLGAAGMKSVQKNARKPCSGARLELSPAEMAANEWNMLAYLAPCKSCHLRVYPWEREKESETDKTERATEWDGRRRRDKSGFSSRNCETVRSIWGEVKTLHPDSSLLSTAPLVHTHSLQALINSSRHSAHLQTRF